MPEDTISPTLRHRPRSLVTVRSELEAQLRAKRTELVWRDFGDETDVEVFGSNFRSFYRELRALRKRIAILDAEIAQRQRAA